MGNMDSTQYLDELLKNSRWIRGLAQRMLTDDHLVDDVVQQTYMTALRTPPPNLRSFRAWVSTVVRNRARMTLRENQRRRHWEGKAARSELETATLDAVEQEELRLCLTELVHDLREPYRSTVVLYYYEGLSSSEIAQREGIPPNTVRVRMRRAVSQLKERIEQKYNGDSKSWRLGLMFLAGVTAESVVPTGADEPGIETAAKTGGGSHAPAPVPLGRYYSMAGVGVIVLSLVVWLALVGSEQGTGPTTSPTDSPEAQRVLGTASHTPSSDNQGTAELRSVGQQTAAVSAAADGSATDQAVVRVVDATTGDPVAGARVSLAAYRMDSASLSRGRNAAQIVMHSSLSLEYGPSNAEGELQVPADELATHEVAVTAPGYQEYRERTRLRELDSSAYRIGLRRAERATLELIDTDGNPIAGQLVSVQGTSAGHEGFTDESGHHKYVWEDAAYLFTAQVPGYAAVRDLATLPVTRVKLEAGVVSQGMVVDGGERPIPGCTIELESNRWRGESYRTSTASDGSFETLALPERGTARVRITHPDFAATVEEFRLPRQEPWRFRLAEGLSVEGRVIDPLGRAVNMGEVRLIPSDGPFFARDLARGTVQEDGSFNLGPVALGEYVVAVSHPEFATQEVPIDGSSTGLRQITARLETGTEVSGRAIDADGTPIPGVRVQLGSVCGDELWGPEVTTDVDGRFRFRGVPRSPLPVRATLRDPRWTAVETAAGTHRERGLLLQVHRPDNLLSKNGQPIIQYGPFGSRNTCTVEPSEQDIELVLEDRTSAARWNVELVDESGAGVRTVTNLLVIPNADPVDGSMILFCGMGRSPVKVRDTRVLQDCLLGFLTRSYATTYATLEDLDPEGRPKSSGSRRVKLEPRRERTLRVTDPFGAPVPRYPVVISPVLEGREFTVGIFVGATNDQGLLRTNQLASGTYRLLQAPAKHDFSTASPGLHLLSTEDAMVQGDLTLESEPRGITEFRLSTDRESEKKR